MSVGAVHYRLSVARYDQMIRAGILTENDPVELIRGELLEKMPIGDLHVGTVIRLTRLFIKRLPEEVTVSIQNPVVFADSEPEPDVAILRPKTNDYGSRKPTPEDLLLLVEVAESSLEFDRATKLPLYAEAGIAEYWIANLLDEQLEVYQDPRSDGFYGSKKIYRRGDILYPLAFPELLISVSEILG